ncbi:MAG: hypothetical protein BMS9Abin26_0479 [Gammaproteobacteria bacterium]|nr:MAG: hypothetical protein BMS9Abin26_0479 [Gammaproteobacteria bacterium]
MKKLAIVAALALSVGVTSAEAAATRKQAADAIFSAVNKTLEAAKAGGEWRDTYKKVIGKAKDAYKKGEYDSAVKLANKAERQSINGIKQVRAGANAGIPDYVYKDAGVKK